MAGMETRAIQYASQFARQSILSVPTTGMLSLAFPRHMTLVMSGSPAYSFVRKTAETVDKRTPSTRDLLVSRLKAYGHSDGTFVKPGSALPVVAL